MSRPDACGLGVIGDGAVDHEHAATGPCRRAKALGGRLDRRLPGGTNDALPLHLADTDLGVGDDAAAAGVRSPASWPLRPVAHARGRLGNNLATVRFGLFVAPCPLPARRRQQLAGDGHRDCRDSARGDVAQRLLTTLGRTCRYAAAARGKFGAGPNDRDNARPPRPNGWDVAVEAGRVRPPSSERRPRDIARRSSRPVQTRSPRSPVRRGPRARTARPHR